MDNSLFVLSSKAGKRIPKLVKWENWDVKY